MMVTIYQWVQTKNDRRYEAGGTTSCRIECKNAAAIARDLNENGERSKFACHFPARLDGECLAIGHGVSVKYGNGSIRTFRG
jgi:hypothetical protein